MKLHNVAFLSVVYPECIAYLKDFMASISGQSFKKFDTVIFNDGLENFSRFARDFSLNVIEIKISGTPAFIRQEAINYLIGNGYDVIIFGDSDDYFESRRVETILKLLENYDIVVNDYDLVDKNGNCINKNYLSRRICDKCDIKPDSIVESNIFGFTNTALKINGMEMQFFCDNLIAVDWYFFVNCLLNGYTAVFTNETRTFYRQHEKNLVGALNFDQNRIMRAIDAKYYHYMAMSKLDADYVPFYEKYRRLKNKLEVDCENFIHEYTKMVNSNIEQNSFWWENIKCIEEM